jgi:hypothetical protein
MQVLLGSSAVAHFFMTSPPTWLDPHGIHQFEGGRSSAGCTGEHAPGAIDRRKQGCIMEWYTNDTTIPGNSTIAWDSPLITYKQVCGQDPSSRCCGHDPVGAYAVCDWTSRNPWRAPGSAPIVSPCGFDGGNPQGCPPGNPDPRGCAQGGYGHGPDGRSLRGNLLPANWTIGGEAEVAWAIAANHGGGYSFRLCPKPKDHMALTEECFQDHPLRFVGDVQWVQDKTQRSTRTAIRAVRTDVGTHPRGSQWTRNPVPACDHYGGGVLSCTGEQFPPPVGPGGAKVKGFRTLPWNIVDRVKVPSELPAGDYVLSFRHDCEQTPQVWNQCADVRLREAA